MQVIYVQAVNDNDIFSCLINSSSSLLTNATFKSKHCFQLFRETITNYLREL